MSVEVKSLRKEFNTPSGIEVAVDNIDLKVNEGEFVTLVGPSGCGKTTTLRCIAGLEKPTSGEITINNKDVTDLPANKRNISMMFQNIALYPHMKIRDNIGYPLKVRRVNRETRDEEVEKAASIMQIHDMLDKHPGELSGGQRQRAALARTLVQEPQLFLMDEPLSDLDAKLKVEIRKEIQRIHRKVKKPTIYVTHDQEEAMTMSDRIAVMNDGSIQQIGTPAELYNEPNTLFISKFIGTPTINQHHGSLSKNPDGSYAVRVDGNTVPVSLESDDIEELPQDVIIAVRPENIELTTERNLLFHGELELIERIGDRKLATIDGPQGEVRAVVPSENELEEGETVPISIGTNRIHVFDEAGGKISSGSAKVEKVTR